MRITDPEEELHLKTIKAKFENEVWLLNVLRGVYQKKYPFFFKTERFFSAGIPMYVTEYKMAMQEGLLSTPPIVKQRFEVLQLASLQYRSISYLQRRER